MTAGREAKLRAAFASRSASVFLDAGTYSVALAGQSPTVIGDIEALAAYAASLGLRPFERPAPPPHAPLVEVGHWRRDDTA